MSTRKPAIRALLIGSNRCDAAGFIVRGRAPVTMLCRVLLEAMQRSASIVARVDRASREDDAAHVSVQSGALNFRSVNLAISRTRLAQRIRPSPTV
jgi:hypothetical protein